MCIAKIKSSLVFLAATILLFCKSPQQNTKASFPKSIWHIFQDTKGNYWFGSKGNGVFFYNGEQTKHFTADEGLVSNDIRGIQEDASGNIFIETPKGISQFNGTSFRTLKPVRSPNNQWELKPTDLWFRCNANAKDIFRFDGENLIELQLPRKLLPETNLYTGKRFAFDPYGVYGINKDKAGNLWIGTCLAGAFRYDGQAFTWFDEKELGELADGRVPGVRAMVQDMDGYFWLGNLLHKYRLNADGSYEKLPGIDLDKQQTSIELPYFMSAVLHNKSLWMASYNDGVWQYDGKTLKQYLPVKGDQKALCIALFLDKDNNLWLGTDNAGVHKFNGNFFETTSF